MSKSKFFPYLEAVFAVVIWGASFIATKTVMDDDTITAFFLTDM